MKRMTRQAFSSRLYLHRDGDHRVGRRGLAVRHPVREAVGAHEQGLTLVHFSAQPEPFLINEATLSVHFSAQTETFLPMRPLNIAHTKSSLQAEKLTSVVHKSTSVELKSGQV